MGQPILKIYETDLVTDPPAGESRDNYRLLVVDDDAMMVEGLKEILTREGYEVRTATHARDALELLRRETFSLVLSDHRMPQMTGLELLAETKVIQPEATRMLITGVVNLQTVIEAINKGEIYRFIVKPWRNEELLVAVKNGVQRHELVCRNQELQRTTQTMNQQLAALNQCLEDKIQLETVQSHQVTELNRALVQNFQRSVELCFRSFQAFYPELGRRARQTHALCSLMEAELHLATDQWRILETSAWLYDIGLVGLPPSLVQQWLSHPDSLSPPERLVLQSHPALGQELASFVYDMAETGSVIRAHHERFDGAGFPDGLSGDDIPWLARLLGVAVAYVDLEAAGPDPIEQILNEEGTAFDPEAVAVLGSCLKRLDLPRPHRSLPLAKLKPGMVLAEDVLGADGLLLLPAEEPLCEAWITHLLRYNRLHTLPPSVAVYA